MKNKICLLKNRKLSIFTFILFILVQFSICYGQKAIIKNNIEGEQKPCGPRALQIVMSLLDTPADFNTCMRLTNVDPNGSTTLLDIQKASKELGRNALGMHLSSEELKTLNAPAILHITLPTQVKHFIVYKPGKEPYFTLIDTLSEESSKQLTLEQLDLIWKGDCLIFPSNNLIAKFIVAFSRTSSIIILFIGCLLGSFVYIFTNRIIKNITFHSKRLFQKPIATIFMMTLAFLGLVTIVLCIVCFINPIKYLNNDAQLVTSTSIIDFGDINIETSKPINGSIWIGNSGSKVLNIDPNFIKKTCSCLKVSLSNSQIKPGEREILKINWNPPKIRGSFEQSILIPYNKSGSKQWSQLKVKGNGVGSSGNIFPPRLYFGKINNNKIPRKKLVYIRYDSDIKILNISCDAPYIECKLNEKSPEVFEINISIKELPKSGPFEGTIKILTNDPTIKYAEITVPFSGIVSPHELI